MLKHTKITWATCTNVCELCHTHSNIKRIKDDCGVMICHECFRMEGTPISNALHLRASKLTDDEIIELIDKKQL